MLGSSPAGNIPTNTDKYDQRTIRDVAPLGRCVGSVPTRLTYGLKLQWSINTHEQCSPHNPMLSCTYFSPSVGAKKERDGAHAPRTGMMASCGGSVATLEQIFDARQ